MYITNITKVRSSNIAENKSHPEYLKRTRKLANIPKNGNGHGKEYVSTWFDTERDGLVHVDLCPTENTGVLEIYVNYMPGEGGLCSRKIFIDIETGDIITNTIEKLDGFHSKFPFTNDESEDWKSYDN